MMLLMADTPDKKADGGDAGEDADKDGGAERRRYRRLQVPVFCRPAGMQFMTRRHPVDLSFGGVRIFSDQPFKKGELLTLEFFAADAPASTFTAEVVWIDELPAGSPARFDVGLRFKNVDPVQVEALETMLGPERESQA
jgi:hypothetical protein